MANTDTPSSSHSTAVKDSRDQLVEDLKRVIADAQQLAEEAKDASGAVISEKLGAARAELTEQMGKLRETGGDLYAEVIERADCLEATIRKNPWRSVAVAVVAGLLIDRLILRR